MEQERVHAKQELRDHYSTRSLDTDFPQLNPYLFSGARVLDVGCGPGTITLDVANKVHPGQVFGIDPVEKSIEQADRLKAERKVPNRQESSLRKPPRLFAGNRAKMHCNGSQRRYLTKFMMK